jgi:hypothetical protein
MEMKGQIIADNESEVKARAVNRYLNTVDKVNAGNPMGCRSKVKN